MKIYTRTGDEGQTAVVGGRVYKHDLRVEAYGTVDEANSFVGTAIAALDRKLFADLIQDLTVVQHELFDCGGDLAILHKEKGKFKVTSEMVERLEQWIDRYDEETPDIQRFILPGGTAASGALHVCRTVVRRAERRVVALAKEQEINEEVRRYLNRLSDFFFTVARVANVREGVGDVEYDRSAVVFRDSK